MSRARPVARSCCCCTAFPRSRHSWRAALPALAAAGYRAVAPDQRGYSPGARPDPADLSNYAFDRLVNDAVEIAAAAGHDGKRFHLVGHDWGGQVSWGVADRHPGRLASLTILSRPHPMSFRRALLKAEDGEQKHRSRHHRAFLEPRPARCCWPTMRAGCATACSARACRRPRSRSIFRVLGNPAAHRSRPRLVSRQQGLAADIGAIKVPTLYIWGDADATVGPDAAHGTRRIRRRGLRHGSAAGRRPFRHGPGAGQGDRADAGAPQEASGLKILARLAAPAESRYHAPPSGIGSFSHGSQEDRADRRRTDRRHPGACSPARRNWATSSCSTFPPQKASPRARRSTSPSSARSRASTRTTPAPPTTRTSRAPTSSSSPRACRASPA